jgi:hypothetical protein
MWEPQAYALASFFVLAAPYSTSCNTCPQSPLSPTDTCYAALYCHNLLQNLLQSTWLRRRHQVHACVARCLCCLLTPAVLLFAATTCCLPPQSPAIRTQLLLRVPFHQLTPALPLFTATATTWLRRRHQVHACVARGLCCLLKPVVLLFAVATCLLLSTWLHAAQKTSGTCLCPQRPLLPADTCCACVCCHDLLLTATISCNTKTVASTRTSVTN